MGKPKTKADTKPADDDDDSDDDTEDDDAGTDTPAGLKVLSDLIDARLEAFAEKSKSPDRTKTKKPHGILNFLDSLADPK